MKKVLILVLSNQNAPYDEVVNTSITTWDKEEVEGVETVYYFGEPVKNNTDKFIYFPVKESYGTIGYKMIYAFDWCLKNKEFDYIARVNSSTYVNKKELLKYVQQLPNENVFAGLRVEKSVSMDYWNWGGCGLVFSKDVIEKVVKNQEYFEHNKIEDVAVSHLLNRLNVPYTPGLACSIDKLPNGWRCVAYGSESFEFTEWEDIKKAKEHFFFRCKHDPDRSVDKFVMHQLLKYLG